jgi:hypothetical protein
MMSRPAKNPQRHLRAGQVVAVISYPVEPGRINIYERWESDEDLLRFRTPGGPDIETPDILGADVRKYRIAGVEAP